MYDTLFLENFDVSQLIKKKKKCHTSYLCMCVVSCTSSWNGLQNYYMILAGPDTNLGNFKLKW